MLILGRTYANKCELQKAGCVAEANNKTRAPLKEDYMGKQIEVPSISIYMRCVINWQLRIWLDSGECCEDENCPYSFAPVCDSEGRTHANKCVFKREECIARRRNNSTLTIQYEGACCNQPCSDDAAPVCDGNTTHKNLCLFRCVYFLRSRN